MVLVGRPTLRTLDSERELEPGAVVACPVGPSGAHRIDNRTDEVARFLVVSTMLAPEVNEYPDSRKVWARTYPPGGDPGEHPVEVIAKPADNLDYLEGET